MPWNASLAHLDVRSSFGSGGMEKASRVYLANRLDAVFGVRTVMRATTSSLRVLWWRIRCSDRAKRRPHVAHYTS